MSKGYSSVSAPFNAHVKVLPDVKDVGMKCIRYECFSVYYVPLRDLCILLCNVFSVYEEFESLLEERASIESFIDWLHSLVDRCVVQVSRQVCVQVNCQVCGTDKSTAVCAGKLSGVWYR